MHHQLEKVHLLKEESSAETVTADGELAGDDLHASLFLLPDDTTTCSWWNLIRRSTASLTTLLKPPSMDMCTTAGVR